MSFYTELGGLNKRLTWLKLRSLFIPNAILITEHIYNLDYFCGFGVSVGC